MSTTPPYRFEPVVDRRYSLPGDRLVAVWVVLNVEWFRYEDPDASAESPRFDTKWYGRRDYGSRVGLWRLVDVLDDRGVPATYALNAAVCAHQPRVVDAALEREWALMGHGVTNSERLSDLPPAEAERAVRETTERIEAYAGEAPAGWLSPGLRQSPATVDHLEAAGYDYVCDFPADDVPFPFARHDLVGVPYSLDLNDKRLIERQGLTGPAYRDAIVDAFETLREEAGRTGIARVLPIPLHPFVTGQPHLAPHLGDALDHVVASPAAWVTTGDDIAAHYRASRG